MGSCTKVSITQKKNMNICGYMHVYIEVRSVSSREGTDICEFAHDGFVYTSFYDLKDVYLCVCM